MKYDPDLEPMENIATGLHEIAIAINTLSNSVGVGRSIATSGEQLVPGALEFIGMQLRDGLLVNIDFGEVLELSRIADALDNLAEKSE